MDGFESFEHARHRYLQVYHELEVLTDKDSGIREQLLSEAQSIATYFLTHNAVKLGCDCLSEIGRLDLLQYCVDDNNYPIVCLYIAKCVGFVTYPLNIVTLQTAVKIIRRFNNYTQALRFTKQLNEKQEEMFFKYSTEIKTIPYLTLAGYMEATALLTNGIVKDECNHMLSYLCAPVKQLDTCTLCDGICNPGPATCVSTDPVNLYFASAEVIEVSEQTCTELCTPVQVKASCTVQVDETECLPRVAEGVNTWAQKRFDWWTDIYPSGYIPFCPTLTLLAEPYLDHKCQDQSAVSTASQYSKSKIGSMSNIKCDYPALFKFQSHAQGGGDRSILGQYTHIVALAAAYAQYGDKPGQPLQKSKQPYIHEVTDPPVLIPRILGQSDVTLLYDKPKVGSTPNITSDFGNPDKMKLDTGQKNYSSIFHGHPLRNVVPRSLVTGNDLSSWNMSLWTVPDLFADFRSQIDRLTPHVRFKYDWNCPPRLPLFKSAIGKSRWNKKNTDDLLVDVLWPG